MHNKVSKSWKVLAAYYAMHSFRSSQCGEPDSVMFSQSGQCVKLNAVFFDFEAVL